MRRVALLLVLVAAAACDDDPRPVPEPPPVDEGDERPRETPEREPATPAPDPHLTDAADYLVTVVTPDWDASSGTLARFRRSEEGAWVRDADDDIAVVLGRSGVAWARGVHGDAAPEGHDGPVKREGDGRSPAGAFWLDRALGYAPTAPDGTRIAYQAMTPTVQCIEDESSSHYNRIVDRADTPVDWDSTDLLRRDDGLYELLLFVAQNTEPTPVPGRGSCVLLHVWSSPDATTAGCTAMERDALADVIRGLAPEANMLVQLPASAYDALAEDWRLPPR